MHFAAFMTNLCFFRQLRNFLSFFSWEIWSLLATRMSSTKLRDASTLESCARIPQPKWRPCILKDTKGRCDGDFLPDAPEFGDSHPETNFRT
jgi:hypothetical protein